MVYIKHGKPTVNGYVFQVLLFYTGYKPEYENKNA